MSARFDAVVSRREALVLRSALQRDRLALDVGNLQQLLRIADRAVRGIRMIRARPVLSLAAAATVLGLVPRHVLIAVVRAVVFGGSLLRFGRSVHSMFRRLVSTAASRPRSDDPKAG